MTEKKNPTVEDLEKKLAGIKNTKARVDILSSIVSGYSQEIYSEYDPKISEAKKELSFKNPDQKKDVENIIKAIRNVIGDKYTLRYDVVCKIATGNDLEFNLDFETSSVPKVAAAQKTVDKLVAAKDAADKRLAEWKRQMLYRIANGDDFTEFKIK